MRKRVATILALLLVSYSLMAESSVWTPADDALPKKAESFTHTPLGRFETIAVGSFPIVMFYVGFGFDFAAYVQSGFQSLYAPWPFKDSRAPSPSQSELETRIGTAVLVSLGIAGLDLILRPLAEAKRAKESPDTNFPLPPSDGKSAHEGAGNASQGP